MAASSVVLGIGEAENGRERERKRENRFDGGKLSFRSERQRMVERGRKSFGVEVKF